MVEEDEEKLKQEVTLLINMINKNRPKNWLMRAAKLTKENEQTMSKLTELSTGVVTHTYKSFLTQKWQSHNELPWMCKFRHENYVTNKIQIEKQGKLKFEPGSRYTVIYKSDSVADADADIWRKNVSKWALIQQPQHVSLDKTFNDNNKKSLNLDVCTSWINHTNFWRNAPLELEDIKYSKNKMLLDISGRKKNDAYMHKFDSLTELRDVLKYEINKSKKGPDVKVIILSILSIIGLVLLIAAFRSYLKQRSIERSIKGDKVPLI